MRSLILFPFLAVPALADVPTVVADIAPVHSITSAVMEGVGEPILLLPANSDPHHFQMRPSQALTLQSADVLVWVGEELTPWVPRALNGLGGHALESVEWLETLGLDHLHEDDEHEDHEEEDHSDEEHAEDEEHGGHDHGDIDPHVWLDPILAAGFALEIAEHLGEIDPENAQTYQQNALEFEESMQELIEIGSEELSALRDVVMISEHDGNAYFWDRFELASAGGLNFGEGVPASAARVAKIAAIADGSTKSCFFSEPGSHGASLKTIAPNGADIYEIDEIGGHLPLGPAQYANLIQGIIATVKNCTE